MRIVGGRWAGRGLVSPAGRVRPTAEQVRTAIMELVAPDLEGARIIDLFAGTGALGLEALSRGARSCDFIESEGAALHALKANVAAFRAKRYTRIFDRDAIPFVERLPAYTYDLGFADPPYGSRKLDRIIAAWNAVPFCTVLVLEHEAGHAGIPRRPSRRIDESAVTVLRARRPRGDAA